MIATDKLFALGVPRVRGALAAAQKACGIALHRGVPMETVKTTVQKITHSRAPGHEDLGELEDLFGEFARVVAEIRSTQTMFVERGEPAPWKNWASDTEAGAIEQMKNACRLPIAVGGALMPDAHQGYGLPIGGVLAVRNAVIPYAVGVDIACRMRLTVLDMPVSDLEDKQEKLIEALETETRFGVGAKFEVSCRRGHPVMQEDWSVSPVTAAGYEKAAAQLGTSGCGNHFVEYGTLRAEEDIDEPGFQLKKGVYVALLSHSGSRGTGEAVADYYSAVAQSLHPELPDELRHLAWLDLDTPEGQGYWQAMQLMGRYASANHEIIHQSIARHLGVDSLGFVENHHNFAWKETYNGEELVVHRKGATPAAQGVLGIIPGSMGTAGFVVRGKGSTESWNSCSHGAGRCMSRRDAFKKLSRSDMQKLLDEAGVKLISGSLDESPVVYKDIERVISQQRDLVDVLARFNPRIVKMAPEDDARPVWLKKK